jgi:predicted O-methyltransferase YrrM
MREVGMMPPPPFEFYLNYARCYAVPEVAMDKRHVYLLHDILHSWPFQNALEIGSFNGASSTAFVEAINEGSPMTATFCDVCPTHSLMDVARYCRFPARARITKQPSCEVLDSGEPYDFILVDGNHDAESVAKELMRLIVRKPLCVMAHDTSATETGYPACEGAKLLKDTFRSMNWECLEDSDRRGGERTERGLFFATQNSELFDHAYDAFCRWA